MEEPALRRKDAQSRRMRNLNQRNPKKPDVIERRCDGVGREWVVSSILT